MIFRIKSLFCIFVLLIICAGVADAETLGKWKVFELELKTTNTHLNPYIDVWLNATFTGPNNTKIGIDGFWDGGDIWKIRMSPTEVGKWNYVTFSNDVQLNGKTGSFEAIKSNIKGFITVNPDYPYSFMYSEGTPFFWMGDTLWDDPGLTRFKEYIDLISSYGYNNYHSIIIHDRYEYQNNEGGPPFEMKNSTNRDYDKLRPSFFQALDTRILYANSKGIAPQMYFTWSQEFIKFKRIQFESFEKYMVARYAAYNVMWIISGEYNEESIPSEYAYHGNIVYNKDPYKHPISLHPAVPEMNLVSSTARWHTYITQQTGAEIYKIDVYNRLIKYRIFNKPVVNAEAQYLIDEKITLDDWRKQNWKIMMAGGYLDTGFQSIVWDPNNIYGYSNWTWNLNSPSNIAGMIQMKYLSDFFRTTEFWKMYPSSSISTSGYTLTNSGKEYIIYLPSGGSTSVDLSASTGLLSIEWYNPSTGTYHGNTTVQGGAPGIFTAPDSNDWVLHINSTPTPFFEYYLQPMYLFMNNLKQIIISIL